MFSNKPYFSSDEYVSLFMYIVSCIFYATVVVDDDGWYVMFADVNIIMHLNSESYQNNFQNPNFTRMTQPLAKRFDSEPPSSTVQT